MTKKKTFAQRWKRVEPSIYQNRADPSIYKFKSYRKFIVRTKTYRSLKCAQLARDDWHMKCYKYEQEILVNMKLLPCVTME